MDLTLTVDTYQGSAPDAPLACRFGAAGGTIGRGPGNTMTLPDAAKTVSRVHARIDWTEDGWRLADLGSNPSRHNGRALAGGQPARLANGDLLEIGGYRLTVRTMARASVEAFDAPLGVHDRRGFDPLEVASASECAASECAATQACAHDVLASAAVLADSPLPGPHFDPLAAPLISSRFAPQFPPRPALHLALPTASSFDAHPAHEAPARLDGHAAFAGSESDHVPPEQFAYVPPPGAAPHAPAGGIPHDYDPLDDVAPMRPEIVVERPMAAANDAIGDASYAALLDGLGVDAAALGAHRPAEVARLAGTMLRTAVRGVVDVLLSRSVLKREISLDTTMLVQRDNNPLKFFPDGDGALAQMLRGASTGYLPPRTALENAFDDIRRHELAVLAGTRAAMQHLLGRFDPQAIGQTIEQAGARRGWLDRLPARRKARQWDRLVALHAELTHAGADDLQALCGRAFNDAYERQANDLADVKPLAPSIQ